MIMKRKVVSIMELGSRIRALRTERQLSQEIVAEQLHVSRQAVAKWESGASLPSTANLLALCELFGVSPEQLTAPEPVQQPMHRRCTAPFVLFSLALILLLAGAAMLWRQSQLPDSIIGYADVATGLYVTGAFPLPFLLFGAGVLLAAAGAVFLLRAKRQSPGQ